MDKVKKLFDEINMTWPKVIIFTIIVAAYTALINQVSFLETLLLVLNGGYYLQLLL